jgi:hypothetical protein
VKRLEFIQKLQEELYPHQFDVFCTEDVPMAHGGKGVMMPGCVKCKINFQTHRQYMEHLVMRVLPEAAERILNEAKTTSRAE